MKSLYIARLVTLGILVSGCSKKELIAQKDAEIANLKAEIERYESELATQREMNEELRGALDDLREKESILMEENRSLTHITLDGDARFGTTSARLTDEAKEAIDRIWSVLQNYPDRWVLVEGHADNRKIHPDMRGTYKTNWELSSARAHSVLHYLLSKSGADPARMGAVGYGEHNPAADNMSADGQAANRRVVITVGSKRDVQKRANRPSS